MAKIQPLSDVKSERIRENTLIWQNRNTDLGQYHFLQAI